MAGITISLTIGQQGILNRAQEAGKNYQEAAKKEDEDLAKFLGEADNIIAGIEVPTTPGGDKYTIVDGVPVPKSFKHTEGTKETGFVIRDIAVDEEGNPTSTNGNEFVWVPCTVDGANGSIKYDRYVSDQPTDGIDELTGSLKIKYYKDSAYYFTEAMSSIEIASIEKYGGFYIGRYEVGIIGYDGEIKTSNENNEIQWTGYHNGTAVVQQGKKVWNYITRNMAENIAEGMYHSNNAVESRLCSSYAWDTTLQFIGGDYDTNSIQGNYHNTTFIYTDLKGNTQTKENGDKIVVPTGQTTAVKNIYDMGGNVWEWTSENYSDQNNSCTLRGGDCNYDANDSPARNRGTGTNTDAYNTFGFRLTLYVQ